jgi:ankyrin repeat protein
VDPNFGSHGKRLGKVSGGFFYRKFAFHSSPLHLACKHGDEQLVEHLLHRGANCKSPDAAGLYPIHLVASSMNNDESTPEEDDRRLRCVIRLLDAGAPLVMRDGNHQTVLHAAARSGHSSILRHVMTEWRDSGNEDPHLQVGKRFVNWLDRWYRTPVHWAVLNGRVDALKVALELGCTPTPYKPKAGKRTSVAMEYPLELCDRLYPEDCSDEAKRAKGTEIRFVLNTAINENKR